MLVIIKNIFNIKIIIKELKFLIRSIFESESDENKIRKDFDTLE